MAQPHDFPQTRAQLENLVGQFPDDAWTSFTSYLTLAMREGADLDAAVADAVALCDPMRKWAAREGRGRRLRQRAAALVAVCTAQGISANSHLSTSSDTRAGHQDLLG